MHLILSGILLLLLSHFHHVWLLVILWTIVRQAPVSMEFSRQGYWSGLPSPAPRNLPYLWIKPTSPVSPAFQANSFTAEIPGKPLVILHPRVKNEDFISLIDFNCTSVYCWGFKSHFLETEQGKGNNTCMDYVNKFMHLIQLTEGKCWSKELMN